MELMLWYCIGKIPETPLGLVTSCHEWDFSWFPSVSIGVRRDAAVKWVAPYPLTVINTYALCDAL
jgi:hypothetical protein